MSGVHQWRGLGEEGGEQTPDPPLSGHPLCFSASGSGQTQVRTGHADRSLLRATHTHHIQKLPIAWKGKGSFLSSLLSLYPGGGAGLIITHTAGGVSLQLGA